MSDSEFWERVRGMNKIEVEALLTQVSALFEGGAGEAAKFASKVFGKLAPTNGELEPSRIKLEQVGAFLARIGEPPPMLVQQMLPEKSLILLTGKPKHCKSFMAVDIAHSVVEGKDVFGDYSVNEPGAVVYLAMEDGEYEIANRLLARGLKRDSGIPLYLSPERFLLTNDASWETLKEMVEPISPRMLVIDTAAEALGIRDWSNRSEIVEKMSPMRRFARETCTVLLVAHNRKAQGEYGDEIAGSNAFTGAVDGWLSIYEKQNQSNGNVQLHYRKEGRGGLRGEGIVEMDTHTLKMTGISYDDIAKRKQESEEAEAERRKRAKYHMVEDYLRSQEKGATAGQIAEAMEWTQPTTSRIVREMLQSALLVEHGEAPSKSGRGGKPSCVYTLPVTNSVSTPQTLVQTFFDDGEREEREY